MLEVVTNFWVAVQGEIASALLPLMKAEQLKFAASGREDRDVRMLGTGRPFVVQVCILAVRTNWFYSRAKTLEHLVWSC